MEESSSNDELEEAEQELAALASKSDDGDGDIEVGPGSAANQQAVLRKITKQVFTLTFLAEWGDRSQIATIALAAQKDPYGGACSTPCSRALSLSHPSSPVTLGGIIGHALCTGLAVVGGRMLATKISERTVAYSGGVLFLFFALHSLWVGPE